MKKLILNGKKPTLEFCCSLCESKWIDDDYKIQEQPQNYGMFLFTSSKIEKPVSECPVCKMKSFDSKKYNTLENK